MATLTITMRLKSPTKGRKQNFSRNAPKAATITVARSKAVHGLRPILTAN